MNNTLRTSFRSPATQATQALNDKLNEIAAGVRDLGAQQADPPPPADPPAAAQELAGGDAPPSDILNAFQLLSHGPATPDMQALNRKLSGIAASVLERRRPPGETPPPAHPPAAGEKPSPDIAAAAVVPTAQEPPPASQVKPAGAGAASAGISAAPALPPVPDLRPALAAFTDATVQQHTAVQAALRQMIGLYQSQQQQIERLGREMATLKSRLNQMPY